jgi:hypothetical protein
VPSKSTGHRKTGTEPEEDEEEPMATARAQDKQRRAAAKAQRKSFFSTLLFCFWQYVSDKDESQGKSQQKHSSPLFFSFFFPFFTNRKKLS